MRFMGRVYVSYAFSKLVFALAGLLFIRFMDVDQLALFTLSISLATLLAQPLVDFSNKLYIVFAELGSPGERLATISFLQLTVVAAFTLALIILSPVEASLSFLVTAVLLSIVCFETIKTFFQSAERFNVFWQLECARAALYLAGITSMILAYDTSLRASEALAIQVIAAILPMLHPSFLRTLAGMQHGGLHSLRSLLRRVLRRRRLVRYDFVTFIVLQSLISQLGIFLLKWEASTAQLATYGAAVRYYGFVVLALTALSTVLLPALKRAASAADLNEIFRRHRRLVLLFIPAVTSCAIAGLWIIPWIDGGRYPDAVSAFMILCLSAILSFSFGVFPVVGVSLRMFRTLALHTLIAFGLCAVSNSVFIGWWGANGAAMATLVTHAYFNLTLAFVIRRKLADPEWFALAAARVD